MFPTSAVGHLAGLLAARSLPERIGGRAAAASLYRLRPSTYSKALGAIAIGGVILADGDFVSGNRGRWVLAHELSHTRQHAWLGPFYLPVHVFFQLASALVYLVHPLADYTPQHAYNPLERIMLFVPFDVLVDSSRVMDDEQDRIFAAFGV